MRALYLTLGRTEVICLNNTKLDFIHSSRLGFAGFLYLRVSGQPGPARASRQNIITEHDALYSLNWRTDYILIDNYILSSELV